MNKNSTSKSYTKLVVKLNSKSLRYELKFVFDQARQNEIFNWLFLKTDMIEFYQPRIVNSLYFDNFVYKSASDNLLGQTNRNKYRLRWYDDVIQYKSTPPIFEIKTKKNRLNYKKKIDISCFKNSIIDMKVSCIQDKIKEDISCSLKNNLVLNDINLASLLCSYERKYFQSKVNDVRVTIDKNINYKLPISNMILRDCPNSVNRKIVLEIKFPKEKSTIVTEILKSLSTSSTRHSKYIVGLASFAMINYI